ncbi:MAG: hypothetical protein QOF48_1742 [Verrucomicrobiota bacterium]|jgi:hypothetical protein
MNARSEAPLPATRAPRPSVSKSPIEHAARLLVTAEPRLTRDRSFVDFTSDLRAWIAARVPRTPRD